MQREAQPGIVELALQLHAHWHVGPVYDPAAFGQFGKADGLGVFERVVDIGDDRQRLILDKGAGKQLRRIADAGATQGNVQPAAFDLCQQRLAGVFDDLERHLRLDTGQL
ncbi:hypothetical protein D3C76_1452840 [compost metagenome]